MREKHSKFFLFIYFSNTSTRTTDIIQSTRTASRTQAPDESYVAEEEDHHPGDMIGQIVADTYRIQSKIGAGSFGQVYLCEHMHTHEQWAIKIELNSSSTHPILAGEVNDQNSLVFVLIVLVD